MNWQIPDPKHLEPEEFNKVRDMVRDHVKGLLAELGAQQVSNPRGQVKKLSLLWCSCLLARVCVWRLTQPAEDLSAKKGVRHVATKEEFDQVRAC